MSRENLEKGISAFERGDYAQAMCHFLSLAESGDAKAQCYVATMYQGGLGVEANGPAAVAWYVKAAEQNIAREKLSGLAFHNLATIYVTGAPGLPPDQNVARQYYQRAVELGVDLNSKA